jgi:hypothetical protein
MVSARRVSWLILISGLVAVLPAASQDRPEQDSSSVAQAARAARERVSESAAHPRVLTNDDFPQRPGAGNSAFSLPPGQAGNAQLDGTQEEAVAGASACYDPAAAQSIAAQLQAAQDQRDQLQHDLSDQPPVISDHDLDLQNYKPGSSGISVGSLPLQESQPEAPARVDIAALDEQIAAHEKSLQLACDSPQAASIQRQLDAVNTSLDSSQRQLALDQDAFYSNPNRAGDNASQTRLTNEQQYVDSLVSQKDQLKDQLATIQANEQPATPPAGEQPVAQPVQQGQETPPQP